MVGDSFKLTARYAILFDLLILYFFTGFSRKALIDSGIYGKIVVLVLIAIYEWIDNKIRPPPPIICGAPNGPPVTSPRIKLSDGRFLAYKEKGVAKEKAKYKIIVVHGFFDNSKDFDIHASQEFVEELGIYFLFFDRAGYGESDPNPKSTMKSEATDIHELADQLEIGPQFYIIGASMGCCSVWSCLRHIPLSIAGATLVAPVVNYWWPSFPPKLSRRVYKKLPRQDQWAFRVAHYAPRFLYWWLRQKWFPTISALERSHGISQDMETLNKMEGTPQLVQEKARQRGVLKSLHRDLVLAFGNWEFDPMDSKNPFPHSESSVHIWQGNEDSMASFEVQRYISVTLPWVHYHEVPDGGHLLLDERVFADAILRELLFGEEPSVADLFKSKFVGK